MTAKTLEEEAREAQKKAGFLAQPSNLSGCQHEHSCAAFRVNKYSNYFDGQPCDCGANSRWGDLAAKRMRENDKEIEELQAKLASMREPIWMLREEHEREIEELRARVKELEGMVPRWVEFWYVDGLWRDAHGVVAAPIAKWDFMKSKMMGTRTYWLMVPPIPLPGEG